MLVRDIQKHVEKEKARHKWLKVSLLYSVDDFRYRKSLNLSSQGGVEFIDVIPKSPSGKILRRMLRDKDREARRQRGAKL